MLGYTSAKLTDCAQEQGHSKQVDRVDNVQGPPTKINNLGPAMMLNFAFGPVWLVHDNIHYYTLRKSKAHSTKHCVFVNL